MGGPIFHRQVQARDSRLEERPHNQGVRQRELRHPGIKGEERGSPPNRWDLHGNVM